MKKIFLLITCAVLSMSIFAQTPAAPATIVKHHSSKIKADHANTKNSKTALANDKSKMKSDKAANTSG